MQRLEELIMKAEEVQFSFADLKAELVRIKLAVNFNIFSGGFD